MVSGRQKFIIGIVVVAIVSGCFWVIANAHPQQTAAQALILRAEERGPGWDSGDGYADRSTDQGVMSQSDHAYRPGNATGATVAFDVDLIIFDSKENCAAAFERFNTTHNTNDPQVNYSYLSIGDRAFHFAYVSGYPNVYLFTRGTALCWVFYVDFEHPFDGKWTETLMDIVELQPEKIERHA
jgi:hypothetical protein